MRRRSLFLTILILLTAIGLAVGILGLLLKQEPDYYTTESAVGTDATDPQVAADLLTKFGDLKNDIRSKSDWGATFAATELNAFFRDSMSRDNGLGGVLPDGLSDPRVSINGDRFRLAARYGSGFWSSVLSVELRGWLVKDEPNTVALELCGLWAGNLPLGSQSMLDAITEAARDANVVVTWYRNEGHPVGVFRFYADQPQPTTLIRQFKIEDGKVTVVGKSLQGIGATPSAADPKD